MINTMLFPAHSPHILDFHYYRHFRFFSEWAKLAGISVEILPEGKHSKVWAKDYPGPNAFSVVLDGKQLIIDYSDLLEEGVRKYEKKVPYIKYYYYDLPECRKIKNLYPVGSQIDIQDGTYEEFFDVCETSYYKAQGDIVLCNQLPHTRALDRRLDVQSKLKEWYGDNADTSYIPMAQKQFWNKLQECFISVVVPGACNSCIDRGHCEQLALGICTISPHLETLFPRWEHLIPNKHYLMCRDDYSDLKDVIHWAYTHKEECVNIGRSAAQLFKKCYTPSKYFEYIENIVKGVI
mgnify:CR=1 FL=1